MAAAKLAMATSWVIMLEECITSFEDLTRKIIKQLDHIGLLRKAVNIMKKCVKREYPESRSRTYIYYRGVATNADQPCYEAGRW